MPGPGCSACGRWRRGFSATWTTRWPTVGSPLTYAEATGELRRTALAQARLAHVLRWRGDFAEADRLFAQANSVELPDRLRAALHEHAGRSATTRGGYGGLPALRAGAGPARRGRRRTAGRGSGWPWTRSAARAEADGFGAYPRESGGGARPGPAPDADAGRTAVGLRERRTATWSCAPGTPRRSPSTTGWPGSAGRSTDRWSLIDLLGTTVIAAVATGRAQPFSDGLAWVSMAARVAGRRSTRPTRCRSRPASPRYDRSGVGWPRCGARRWGAVDRTGRVMVPTRYHGFVTDVGRRPADRRFHRRGAGRGRRGGSAGRGGPRPARCWSRRRTRRWSSTRWRSWSERQRAVGRAGPARRAAHRSGAPRSRRGAGGDRPATRRRQPGALSRRSPVGSA